MNRIARTAALIPLLIAAASAAQAATVSLNSIDNGWYNSRGEHNASNASTFTGVGGSGAEFRSFYVFNLPVIAPGEVVLGATLSFAAGTGSGNNFGTVLTKTVGLFDFLGSVDALLAGNNGVGTEAGRNIFSDLGSGTSYGSTTLTKPPSTFAPMPQFSIDLGTDALADILSTSAASDRRFAIGAALLLANPAPAGEEESLWSSSNRLGIATLSFQTGPAPVVGTVPVPGTLALAGLGLALMRLRRRA